MSDNKIQTIITFNNETQIKMIDDEVIILDTLGEEEAVALQLRDLFDAVKEALEGAVDQESELNIEVNASLSATGTGGVKTLVFNVGGELTKGNTMKISLKTKIKPQAA